MNLPLHALLDSPSSSIRNVHCNSSGRHFTISTTDGFTIYQTEPLLVISRREIKNGSLSIVLPLESSNLIFLVGGGATPLYPPNKVLLWDDKVGNTVAELEFRENVMGLVARRDRLVVVLKRRVILFVLGRGELGIWREGVWETGENPLGLVSLATEVGSTLLAFPGLQAGQVQLVNLPPLDLSIPVLPPSPSHDPTIPPFPSISIILAHTSALSALASTPDGKILATTSSKGTLLRIWDMGNFRCVRELRRGLDEAKIFGVALRADGQAVAVTSDKGTIHIWDLKAKPVEKDTEESSRKHQLSLLKPYLPKYFSSEWSHSQFRLPPPAPTASRLPFSLSNTPSSNNSNQKSSPLTIEDDVVVCTWITVETVIPIPSRKGKERQEQYVFIQPPMPKIEFQLIAITHSGSWFRISLDTDTTGKDAKGKSFGLGKESTAECALVEHRRLTRDGW